MSTSKSGNATHDTKVQQAESVRQATVPATVAITAGPSRATVVTAEATFARAAAVSAAANSVQPVVFLTMLRELGQPLYA